MDMRMTTIAATCWALALHHVSCQVSYSLPGVFWKVLTALLGYNSRTITLTRLRYIYDSVAFSVLTINFRIFSLPRKETQCQFTITPQPPHPPSPWQPPVCFLSLWICLFWIFHIYVNGIIQYVVLCDWLLPLSMVFSRSSHVGACISTSFLFKFFF